MPDAGDEDDAGSTLPGWVLSRHPCDGHRTDTLFCENEQTCYVGCGTTTAGNQGYYVTTDGGATWAPPETTPANFFRTSRVNSISRDGDRLYVAGQLGANQSVVSVSASGEVDEVFERGDQTWNGFPAGELRCHEGRCVLESKTGTGIVVKEGVDAAWGDGAGFWADGDDDDVEAGVQIQDLEVFGGAFWAVGSRIIQPPIVFTPKWDEGAFDFGIVPLATGLEGFNGELLGIDIDEAGVVVGGVNHDEARGIVYSLPAGADPNVASNWRRFDVGTLLEDRATWVHDVCRHGDTIYAVGRESRGSWGFILRSEDGGETFADITPYGARGESLLEEVSRCQAFEGGVITAGGGGQVARNF